MFRELWMKMICMWKGHRKGDLYHWMNRGPFLRTPGCLRCKTEFPKERP